MKRAIYLKKLSMSSFIDESGLVVPVTILKYIDQEFLGFKTTEKHGYNAIQYGFGLIKKKKIK